MSNTKESTSKSENLYMQLNESEITAIIMKSSPHSNDRDAGFCSGSSEGGDDNFSVDHTRLTELSSPNTNASDDSVDVKVTPIALLRHKRKSSEPSKVICEREESNMSTAPLKKRIRYTSTADSAVALTPTSVASPTLQSWDSSQVLPHELMPNPAQVFVRHPGVTTLHRVPGIQICQDEQIEPLALVKKKSVDNEIQRTEKYIKSETLEIPSKYSLNSLAANADKSYSSPIKSYASSEKSQSFAEEQYEKRKSSPNVDKANVMYTGSLHDTTKVISESTSSNSCSASSSINGRPQQRNYKNMTRERRIEANARERTRVHTISAAYETLRRSVPSYSDAQKLSKLSVLRVACSYILALSRMAGEDYSEDQSAPSVASCFDEVTATIQTEGKVRKKKNE